MKPPSAQAISALREVLTGSTIRQIAGVRDQGELSLAKAHNADGGELTDVDSDGKDIWIHYTDALSETPSDSGDNTPGHPGIARLHIPGNILFAIPNDLDTVMIARARDAHGPGNPYLFLGDGGTANRVPSWATGDTPKDGLYTPRTLRLESTDNIEINADADNKTVTISSGGSSGKVTIVAGGTSIEVDKDGNVLIVPNSGSVVSIGDTASNTHFMASNGEDLVTLVNSLKTQLNNLISDVGMFSVVGEADLIGVPLPTAMTVTATSVSNSSTAKNS